MTSGNLALLRNAIERLGLDGFVLPLTDEFMGEYIPESEKRLSWLTGFTGSAGVVAITRETAAFFTDGRYTLQAKDEVSPEFEIHNAADIGVEAWLLKHTQAGAKIGFDSRLHTVHGASRLVQSLAENHRACVALDGNPVDVVWEGRPPVPATPIIHHPLSYSGKSTQHKCQDVAAALKACGADAAILTANDSVCWLLNIRANDIPYTPFARCYAIAYADEHAEICVDANRLSPEVLADWKTHVKVLAPGGLEARVSALGQEGKTILLDPSLSSAWVHGVCVAAHAKLVLKSDPCQLMKACKNAVEVQGARKAHETDGLALTRFLFHLSKHASEMTEQDVCDVLESYRARSPDFLEPSFPTISGSGSNGAIVHYRVTERTNRKLENNTLMLIDSGGQYRSGTTDVTRTVAIGTPTQAMREHFTRVLKGHIALATAVFPDGTGGIQLDALARYSLWQAGLDYDHGTGHGVGSYLSVHEGPQRISKKSSDIPLKPGMIVSNEPGYYKSGEYGIRIENLVVVKEYSVTPEGKTFYAFETLTLAPIDRRLVMEELLTDAEKLWLNSYHKRILEVFTESLNKEEKQWVESHLL